jgi:hypothetical protein
MYLDITYLRSWALFEKPQTVQAPLVPILSQINPIHINPFYLSKINFTIVHPPRSSSSQWSLSFWLAHQYPICIPLFPHSSHMPRPSYPSWLDHSKYTWRRVQVMKILNMQFPPTSCHFIHFGPNILLNTLFSNTLSVCSLMSETKYLTHIEPQAKL